jgi:hypothetical protein
MALMRVLRCAEHYVVLVLSEIGANYTKYQGIHNICKNQKLCNLYAKLAVVYLVQSLPTNLQ